MSFVLAALGFMALIVLHELGHFVVAKAVGMRVERFSLFFPPLIWRHQGRGETEYAIGAIPLGGYVKISGMNPHEELPVEVAHRAYYRQKPWKRIAVILAGPAVNIVLAFVIFGGLILTQGVPGDGAEVKSVERNLPAAGVLESGDRIVAVDGQRGDIQALSDRIASHRCQGELVKGCVATTPARLTIERGGQTVHESIRPVYDAAPNRKRMRLGFMQEAVLRDAGIGDAARGSLDQMWFVTSRTATVLGNLFDAKQRKQLHGVVGSYETARAAVKLSLTDALFVLGLISLSLGIVNLFPFLPLDGGHVFWAVAEKVRGKAIPFRVMERSGFVGFALVLGLFAIGLSNDINTLLGPGFNLSR
ncbi:MAG: M50 family metallopeptidase [Solirubrobacteraceae bacterium]